MYIGYTQHVARCLMPAWKQCCNGEVRLTQVRQCLPSNLPGDSQEGQSLAAGSIRPTVQCNSLLGWIGVASAEQLEVKTVEVMIPYGCSNFDGQSKQRRSRSFSGCQRLHHHQSKQTDWRDSLVLLTMGCRMSENERGKLLRSYKRVCIT